LLAREMLPEAWLAPEEIQRLRDKTRLRKALADDHTRWAQRLHALLVHEGWPCSRGSLLTPSGRRWVAAIRLDPGARAQVEAMLTVMAALDHQIYLIDCELRRLAKSDERLRALQRIFGIGPILAATILAEIGDAKRFRRARQVIRASAWTRSSRTPPTSSAAATSPSGERRACAGRWWKPRSTHAASAAQITSSTCALADTPAPTRQR
jgi:transposase